MSDIQLPEGFTGIDQGLPPEDKPVLGIRLSAYGSTRFEVITARHQPGFRPLAPWRDLGGDAVTDSGEEILGWRLMDEWLQPTR